MKDFRNIGEMETQVFVVCQRVGGFREVGGIERGHRVKGRENKGQNFIT